MMVLRAIMISVEVIISVLLVGIILIQKAKGGGLGLAFGGGGGNDSLFGSRAGNVLTKGTVILAILFMLNTVGLAILSARTHDQTLMDAHMRPTQPTAQPQPMATEQAPATTPAPATEQQPAPVEATTVPVEAPVTTPDFDMGSPSPTPIAPADAEPIVIPAED